MIKVSSAKRTIRLPLYGRVLIGVILGISFGILFKNEAYLLGLKNEDLGQLGMLVVRLLKALAIPLILFAILDAFIRTDITARHGGRLLLICLINVSVALAIGLTIMNIFEPGKAWSGKLEEMVTGLQQPVSPLAKPAETPQATLNPLKNLAAYIPESLTEPFLKNNVITIVLLGILVGAAVRRVKYRQHAANQNSIAALEQGVEAIYQVLIQMLNWVVQAIPFAVFGVVAHVVGKTGLELFKLLWIFLVTIIAGLAIHSLIYYPLLAWWIGKKPPQVYLKGGADAIVTGFSTNSSLATVPLTLRCLTENMGISERSARLSACVGTNLNNDGITLYEAMAALFLAQATGFSLDLPQQMVIVLASIMAGVGVAGIPEAGLIVLPLVLGAAGLPEAVVVAAIPLVMPVDWIIARCRSVVNVLSDMVVAILLDRNLAKVP